MRLKGLWNLPRTERGNCHEVRLKNYLSSATKNQPTNQQATSKLSYKPQQDGINRTTAEEFDGLIYHLSCNVIYQQSSKSPPALPHHKIIPRFWTWLWKSSQKTPTISSSLSSPSSSSSCRSKEKLQNTTFKFAKKSFSSQCGFAFLEAGSVRYDDLIWLIREVQWGLIHIILLKLNIFVINWQKIFKGQRTRWTFCSKTFLTSSSVRYLTGQ